MSSSIVASLGHLKAIKGGRPNAQTSERPDVQTPMKIPLQSTGKRNHPQFAKKTIYLRKDTVKAAMRKYEDAGGTEISELVETLLTKYLNA